MQPTDIVKVMELLRNDYVIKVPPAAWLTGDLRQLICTAH